MNWLDFKKDKTTPKDSSWVVIQSSVKYAPKFEVSYYKKGEWYLPANYDSCDEGDIKKWAYIKE